MRQRTDWPHQVVHSQGVNIKTKTMQFLMMVAVASSLVLTSLYGTAQQSNTPKGQMKESGTEVGRAGKSMGRNVRRGRILRGGKHFGKHIGRAGKHFGRGTKKAVKRVIS